MNASRLFLMVFAMGGASVAALGQTLPSWHALTLGEAIAYGLKHSPALRASAADVAAARAEAGLARSRTSLQVSANGFASNGTMPNIMQSTNSVEPQALVMGSKDTFTDANVSLMVPIFTGGYLPGLVAAAVAYEKAAIAEATGMRAEVAFRIRELYYKVMYGAEMVIAQESRVAAADSMVLRAKAMLDAGKGIEASVRRAEAELFEARRDLSMIDNDRKKMLLELLAEIGASMETPVTLADRLSFRSPDFGLAESLTRAFKNRGELNAARQMFRAAEAKLSASQGSQKPQLYGFAMADNFSPADSMGKRSGYSIGLTLSISLLDGGMRRSEISNSRAMRDKARAQLDGRFLQVEKEVRQAWLDIDTATQNYASAQSALIAAQSAYEVIVIRVETGKSILVEQLDSLAALTRAKANVVQALYEHEIAVARLHRAMGESEFEAKGRDLN
jgi:outer membrane protein